MKKIIPKVIKEKDYPIYQIVFNSKYGVNISQLPTYSQIRTITSVTSTTIFIYGLNTETHFTPFILSTAVIFITPVLNTITAIVNVTAQTPASRTVTIASARTFTTSSIAVFLDRTNPAIPNMTLLAETNSTTFTLIASTGMSSVSVGDEVQFGNDRTTILSAMVTNISTNLLTITIDSERTIPINTIVTFFKTTTAPVMKYANNVNYEIDWTTIQRGKYKGSVMMEMWYGAFGAYTAVPPQIFLDLGININTFEAGNPNFANNLGGTSSNYVGIMNSTGGLLVNTYLRTSQDTTSEFFMEWSPANKPVNISLYGNGPTGATTNQNILTKPLWTDGQGCGENILTLTLERLPDDTLPFYNILFNSRASTTPINSNMASNFIQSFYWQVLPDGNYKCSYYTMGTVLSATTANGTIAGSLIIVNQLYWNIPIPNTIEAGNDVTKPTNIWSLGILYNKIQSISYPFWTTGFSQNSPFIISKPQINNVQFRCLTNWDKSVNQLSGSQFPHYILCLRMEKQK